MKKTLFSALLLALVSCSSVQEVQVPGNARTEFPDLAVTAKSSARADDTKPGVRKRDGKVNLFLSVGTPLEDRSRTLQELAFLRLRRAIQFPDVRFETLADPMKNKPEALDGKLTASFEAGKTREEFGIRLKLRDSDEGILVSFRAEPGPTPDQIEIVRMDSLRLARAPESLRVVSDNLRADEIHTMLQDSVMGTLSIQSTGGDTVVRIKGEGVDLDPGPLPVSGKKLLEGNYRIIATRKGQGSQDIPLKLMAGVSRAVVVSWPDDPESGTTAFLSAPSNIRISLDGEVRGSTPLYVLNESAEQSEFAKAGESGKFEVLAQTSLSGLDRSRVLFYKYMEAFAEGFMDLDLWQSVKEKTSAQGVSGLRSRPFVIDEQISQFSFPIAENQGLAAFVTDQDSVFVERVDGAFVVQAGHGIKMDGPKKAFKAIKTDRPERVLSFEYNKEKSLINVELDGSTIYEGPFRPSGTGRFFLFGPESNPVKKLQVRTGRGVYEK
ncbi:MAG: hypothetical protein K8S54_06610 [Spirochaetia bacterium]|nr:hypothetical protein [Spirochaetia bacterium]